MRRPFKAGIALLIAVVLLVIAFFAGMLVENEKLHALNDAEFALRKLNLPEEYAPPFNLHGNTGFIDSYSVVAFQVEYPEERVNLLECIRHAEGWSVAPVLEEELREFAKCFWYPDLILTPKGTVFDAWFYRETSGPISWAKTAKDCFSSIGRIGDGFEFAVYDVDTGFLIFVDQLS